MRFHLLGLAAALCVVGAAPSHAKGYSGYYLATFKVPGGYFKHCFALTQTNSVAGYSASGTWTDTDFPNTAGQFVVFQRTLHLAGYVSDPNETDYLAVDGRVANGTLNTTSFDYFTPNGIYLAAGSFTEMRDGACNIPQ